MDGISGIAPKHDDLPADGLQAIISNNSIKTA
jgi:hypothetical protein